MHTDQMLAMNNWSGALLLLEITNRCEWIFERIVQNYELQVNKDRTSANVLARKQERQSLTNDLSVKQ